MHDALVIEAPIDRIEADVTLAEEIMRRAARVVLNTNDKRHELRTSATIVRYPGRYVDKRGVQVWTDVLNLLERYQRQQSTEPGACPTEQKAK